MVYIIWKKREHIYVDYSVEIDFMDKFLPDYVNLLKEAEEHDRKLCSIRR